MIKAVDVQQERISKLLVLQNICNFTFFFKNLSYYHQNLSYHLVTYHFELELQKAFDMPLKYLLAVKFFINLGLNFIPSIYHHY